MDTRAAVADLKAHLSRYLRRVKAGEEVVITERNVPIARLVPLAGTEAGDEAIRDLEARGIARAGKGRLPKSFWELPRPQDRRASVRRAVAEERESGW